MQEMCMLQRLTTLTFLPYSLKFVLPSGLRRERGRPGDVGAAVGLFGAAGAQEAARPVRRREGRGEQK